MRRHQHHPTVTPARTRFLRRGHDAEVEGHPTGTATRLSTRGGVRRDALRGVHVVAGAPAAQEGVQKGAVSMRALALILAKLTSDALMPLIVVAGSRDGRE